ncbi:hypothetical protein ACFFJX_08200 [Pseudarcicella hirudinis]|nr:hypothetical protein [Pseudarcicella hirudinis]
MKNDRNVEIFKFFLENHGIELATSEINEIKSFMGVDTLVELTSMLLRRIRQLDNKLKDPDLTRVNEKINQKAFEILEKYLTTDLQYKFIKS